MAKAIQQRSLKTRTRLIAAAEELINAGGFEAMRVEEVVLRAGTAKGTFFAHFPDKDSLMDLVIGQRMNAFIDELEAARSPTSVEEMMEALLPLCHFMTSERYVFDVIIRYSGAAAVEEIGEIATSFFRQVQLFEKWIKTGSFRTDVSARLQAEGIQAFLIQALALNFCSLHNSKPLTERLIPYLDAWLSPKP